MQQSVKAERVVPILQETVQNDGDELKEWLAEARADCEEARAKREWLSGQIA